MARILFLPPKLDTALGRLCERAAKACSAKHDCCVLPSGDYIVGDVARAPEVFPVDLLVLPDWHSAWSAMERVTRQQGFAPRLLLALFEGWTPTRSRDTMARFSTVCDRAARIVVANDLIRRCVPEQRPVSVIHDAVDIGQFQPSELPGEFTAGFVGNSKHCLGQVKGLDLIRAACMTVGVRLFAHDTACMKRETPHDMMAALYDRMSVYVCASSEHEGGPVPPIEAAACGRPVISTRTGAMREFVTPDMGRLVDRTPEAIAEALMELAALPAGELALMGINARARAEGWTWTQRGPEWLEAIDAALAEPMEDRPRVTIPDVFDTVMLPPNDGTPLVALVSDVRDWAFDVNLRDLAEYVKGYRFVPLYVVERDRWPSLRVFDRIFLLYHRWQMPSDMPWERALGSVRAQWFNVERPMDPGPAEWRLVNKYGQGFHTVNEGLYRNLRSHCPGVVYLTNPVNTRTFDAMTEQRGVVASWTGNAAHKTADGRECKGLPIIQRACAEAEVPLVIAEYNTCRLPHSAMPGFFGMGSVTMVASLYEGASNSCLEAMACGHAVICTDVGNHRELKQSQLRHFGESGMIFVDRNVPAFVSALNALKADPGRVRAMGEINREEIRARWSWDAWAERYREFIEGDGKRYAEPDREGEIIARYVAAVPGGALTNVQG